MNLKDLFKSHIFTGHETVEKAREWWENKIHGEYVKCPVCNRIGKLYKTPFNGQYALALIWMHQNQIGATWINMPALAPKWLIRSRSFYKLLYWGLIERKAIQKASNDAGKWRVTEKGRAFAESRIKVDSHVYIYNKRQVIIASEQIPTITLHAAIARGNFDPSYITKAVGHTYLPKTVV